MKTSLKTISLLASATLLTLSSFAAVNTIPVGYSTWSINAGDGSSRAITALALPLYQPSSSVNGAAVGLITAVTSNTLTVNGANWSAGELSNSAEPFCVRLTKEGSSAEGRNLLISTVTDNTTDTVTIDLANSGVTDLTELGIVAGVDTFELIECDTLSSLFGEPVEGGIVGASTQDDADVVFLFINGSWSRFYYDTDLSNWKKVSFFDNDASNQVVLPDAGLLFSRKANTSSEFVISGTVPSTDRELTVNASGVTVVGNAWPTDIRLDQSGIENIGEWNSTTSRGSADKVFILTDIGWKRYFHDGADWKEVSFFEPLANDVVIPTGAAVLLVKNTPASGNQELVQALPYVLD